MIRGNVRLFVHSLFFAARNRKRAVIFICVYAVLASGVFFSIARLEHETSVLLRQSSAVWLRETGPRKAEASGAEDLDAFLRKQKLPVEKVVPVTYAETGTGRMLFSVDPAFQWASASINPGLLVEGRFPEDTSGEAVVSDNFTFTTGDFGASEVSPAVGSRLKIEDRTLRITGIISVPEDLPEEKSVIAVPPDDFLLLSKGCDVYLKECIVIAKGSSFMPGLFSDTRENAASIQKALSGHDALWRGKGLSKPASGEEAVSHRAHDALFFPLVFFGLTGSIFASLFYGYLVGRHRLREIAVLKTLGFNGVNVLLYMVAEAALIAAAGIALSFAGIRFYFSVAVAHSEFELSSISSVAAVLLLFCLNIMGFVITSRRARRVEPMTLFRRL